MSCALPIPRAEERTAGRIRCHYPGSQWPDEVAVAGDAYFFRAGHVLIYEEATEALELNPADALEVLMDHIELKAETMVAELQAGQPSD